MKCLWPRRPTVRPWCKRLTQRSRTPVTSGGDFAVQAERLLEGWLITDSVGSVRPLAPIQSPSPTSPLDSVAPQLTVVSSRKWPVRPSKTRISAAPTPDVRAHPVRLGRKGQAGVPRSGAVGARTADGRPGARRSLVAPYGKPFRQGRDVGVHVLVVALERAGELRRGHRADLAQLGDQLPTLRREDRKHLPHFGKAADALQPSLIAAPPSSAQPLPCNRSARHDCSMRPVGHKTWPKAVETTLAYRRRVSVRGIASHPPASRGVAWSA